MPESYWGHIVLCLILAFKYKKTQTMKKSEFGRGWPRENAGIYHIYIILEETRINISAFIYTIIELIEVEYSQRYTQNRQEDIVPIYGRRNFHSKKGNNKQHNDKIVKPWNRLLREMRKVIISGHLQNCLKEKLSNMIEICIILCSAYIWMVFKGCFKPNFLWVLLTLKSMNLWFSLMK